MLDFALLIRNAYRITISHPRLWFFGLFLVGGFNLGFLNFQKFDWPVRELSGELATRLPVWQTQPQVLLMFALGLLVVSLAAFVVTNWARIFLTLDIHSVFPPLQFQFGTKDLKDDHLSFKQLYTRSKKYLAPVVATSLFTTFLLAIITLILLLPILSLLQHNPAQDFMVVVAGLLSLAVTFVISCLNIFALYFIILTGQNMWAALNLSTDLLRHHFKEIIGLAIILVVAYSLCFFAGISVIYSVHFLVQVLSGLFHGFGLLSDSAIIVMSRIISGVIIWFLLAVLNVFFNSCFLLLFASLVKPLPSKPEAEVTPLTATSL